jgi:hypothetical protein
MPSAAQEQLLFEQVLKYTFRPLAGALVAHHASWQKPSPTKRLDARFMKIP